MHPGGGVCLRPGTWHPPLQRPRWWPEGRGAAKAGRKGAVLGCTLVGHIPPGRLCPSSPAGSFAQEGVRAPWRIQGDYRSGLDSLGPDPAEASLLALPSTGLPEAPDGLSRGDFQPDSRSAGGRLALGAVSLLPPLFPAGHRVSLSHFVRPGDPCLLDVWPFPERGAAPTPLLCPLPFSCFQKSISHLLF